VKPLVFPAFFFLALTLPASAQITAPPPLTSIVVGGRAPHSSRPRHRQLDSCHPDGSGRIQGRWSPRWLVLLHGFRDAARGRWVSSHALAWRRVRHAAHHPPSLAQSLHFRHGSLVALSTLGQIRYLLQPKTRFPVRRLHLLSGREFHPLEAPGLSWRTVMQVHIA
jgi:hypothetical protein